jgi:hypothetical protein
MEFKARIEGWAVICMSDIYTAPEMRSYRVAGYVFKPATSTGWKEGGRFLTSRVFGGHKGLAEWLDSLHEGGILETSSGSFYLLGSPDPRPKGFYTILEGRAVAQDEPDFASYQESTAPAVAVA